MSGTKLGPMADGSQHPAGSDAQLLDGERRPAFYRRSVMVMSFGFLGVLGGFQAAQGLQTSLNATLGFINLASLYGTFTVLCLVAPPAIDRLENVVGLPRIMLLSALAYSAMAFSNIGENTDHWALPICMSILVGVGAPMLWTSQSDYLGRCAYHASQCRDAGAEGEDRSLETMTAKLNGIFFSIYQFAGMSGNIVASTLMLALSGKAWMKKVLFAVLGCLCTAGAATFAFMPNVAPACGAAVEQPASPKDTGALAFGDARMTLLVPLIFTNGMALAFILGDYPTDVVCPIAGASFTGFVMAAFFGFASLASSTWGRLLAKKVISRRTAFIVSTLFQLVFFAARLVWSIPQNYRKEGGKWQEETEPAAGSIILMFLLVALFACGDAYYESGAPGTLQNFFLGSPSAVPAMANYKMWQSLGFATQFIIGAELASYPTLRVAILLVMLVISISCLLLLDRKHSIK